jgi:hypothetical protein
MRWGTETEPQARDAYCFFRDVDVEEVGFVAHPTIPMTGASPDGLVLAEGMVEIKCPSTATHIDTLLYGTFPEKYLLQMQWQMACARRAWCDFVSYDPRMPEHMQFYCRRIDRDDALIATLETEVGKFLKQLADTVAELQEKYPAPQRLAA